MAFLSLLAPISHGYALRRHSSCSNVIYIVSFHNSQICFLNLRKRFHVLMSPNDVADAEALTEEVLLRCCHVVVHGRVTESSGL